MRPIKLAMNAFGPYANKQVIDFSQLGGRNLFVISGNTGAGKTTVLDGICYALYGKASGQDRSGESLRSHFAADDLLTAVELEFEIKGKRHWVRRLPKQMKKRSRGSGYTEQGAEAEYRDLSDEQATTVCGMKEVDGKITSLMGISYEQFKQIIMIPQGEFRELLTADSRAREDILQKIFGTEAFRRIQNVLEEQAKALGSEIKELQIRLNEMAVAARSPQPEQKPCAKEELVAATALLAVENWLKEDRQRLEEMKETLEQKMLQIKALQEQCFSAAQSNEKLALMDADRQKYTALSAQTDEMNEMQSQLQRARQAIAVVATEENVTARADETAQKSQLLENARAVLLAATAELEATRQSWELEAAKEAERNRLLRQQADLDHLKEKITALEQKKATLVLLDKERDELERKRLDCSEKRAACQRELQQRRDEWDAAAVAEKQQLLETNELEKFEDVCSKIADLCEENAQWATLQAAAERLKQQLEFEAKDCEDALQRYEQAQQQFYAGQAAVLAETLRADERCPVCGSYEHPCPAQPTEAGVSDAALKKMRKESKTLQERRESSRVEFERVRSEGGAKEQLIAKRLQELRPLTDAAEVALQTDRIAIWAEEQQLRWNERRRASRERLLALTVQVGQLEQLQAECSRTEERLRQQEQELQTVSTAIAALAAKRESAQDAVSGLERDIPQDLNTLHALERKLAELVETCEVMKLAQDAAEQALRAADRNYAQAVQAQETAMQALDEAGKQLKIAERKLQDGFKKAGFTDLQEYRAARLDDSAMTTLEERVMAYRLELQTVQERLLQSERELAGVVRIDVLQLERQQEKEVAEQQALLEEHTIIFSRYSNNERVVESLRELLKQLAGREESYALIGHLAKVAKGDNAQKVSFERYVLAAFFNDIIDAANLRLLKMADGRYEMRRIEERGKGNGQSGLELEVFDYYTGKARHVKTLSGGESFKASLSLALGLADVVQSYSGQVSIETMFVDEGFGTLDPESLDSAIRTLVELQHSGRLVGIISHVPELKASVDARLEVVAQRDGSTATLYVG